MLPFVFIINLAKRKDRRENMEKLMNDLNITRFEFIEPIQITTKPVNYNVSNNEYSLILTVKHILLLANDRHMDKCFIFEDDLVIKNSPEFVVDKIERSIRNLPTEWDMLYFEYCFESCGKIKQFNDYLYKVSNPLCTASILYNVKSIQKVFDCIESQSMNLDNSYANCHKDASIIGYMVAPPLFHQNKKYQTDIQTDFSPLAIMSIVIDTENTITCRHEVFFRIKWFNTILLCSIVILILVLIISSALKIWN